MKTKKRQPKQTMNMHITPIILEGKIVRLEPLKLEHAESLIKWAVDERLWTYMVFNRVTKLDEMCNWIEEILNRQRDGIDLPFAVIHLSRREAIGMTRFMYIDRKHRKLEIGGTWYGVKFQGTGVNLDAKYLLLRHAFENLGCVRVQLKTDVRNLRSQKAIEKLGAVREGILRNHMILPDGFVRHSVMYSIIDSEWPEVSRNLEEKLKYL